MKPEWMPENPYPIEGRTNTIRHFDFKVGCQQTALKLVEEIKRHSIVNLAENPRLIIFRIDRIWWEQLMKEVGLE